MTRSVAGALLVWLGTLPLAGQESVLMQAMRDELQRTMTELRLHDMSKPYFVAYRVHESMSAQATASLGAVVSRSDSASRLLSVEVRVGDSASDNTNFYTRPDFGSQLARAGMPTSLPLEDDYHALRRKLWLATDNAYRHALDQLSKKRAVLQNETQVEQVPDFSVQEAHQYSDDRAPVPVSVAALEALAVEVSAAFRGQPEILVSEVEAGASSERVSFMNSEGSSFTRLGPSVSVQILAGTQAADGTVFEDSVAVYEHAWERLPDRAALRTLATDLATRLQQLRVAPSLDRYTGPILFEGQASAELVRQVLAPRLLANRVPLAADSRMARALEQLGNPFVDKLGARVLPRFLDVVDAPLVRQHGQVALLGGYAVDDDGVAASETTLVQRGILKTLLATRNPVQGVPTSNGHRRGLGAAPSNLFVVPQPGLTRAELRNELLSLLRERDLEFGILVRRIGNARGRLARGQGPRTVIRVGGRSEIEGVVAYKLFPDGREELLGKLVLADLSESEFRDIVAASRASSVHTAPFSGGSPAFGFVTVSRATLVSFVVPSLLFEDVTIKRPSGNIQRPPLVPHPLAGD